MSPPDGPLAQSQHGAQTRETEDNQSEFSGFSQRNEHELKKIATQKAAAVSWLRNVAEGLNNYLQGDPTWHELLRLVEAYDSSKSKWEELSQRELYCIENPEEIEIIVNKNYKFFAEVEKIRGAAAETLERLGMNRDMFHNRNSEGSVVSTSETYSGAHNVQLPKLQLMKFGGKITEWRPFWDQFKALVDDKPMPLVSKFMYLRSVLEGEAKVVIQGLSQTDANYKPACQYLERRYGNPEEIISAHVQGLMQIAMSKNQKTDKPLAALRKLQDELVCHVRSLEALGIGGDQYGLFLAPMILSILPSEMRLEWSRTRKRPGDLEGLLTFLQLEVENRERSEAYEGLNCRKPEEAVKEKKQRRISPGSASALQTSSEGGSSRLQCAFCGKLHPSENCFTFKGLTLLEREDAVRNKRLCFKCLAVGHYAKGCWAKCAKCKSGNHHALICRRADAKPHATPSEKPPEVNNVQGESESVTHVGVAPCESKARSKIKCSVLQTAQVQVVGQQGIASATVMFDTGADRSYISKELVKRVKPKWLNSEYLSFSAFGGGKASKMDLCNVYEIVSVGSNHHKYSFKAAEINVICPPLYRTKIDKKCLEPFAHLNLADDYGSHREVKIDILIGLDLYWKLIIPNKVICHEGLVAHETVFGWVLSGSYVRPNGECSVGVQLLAIDTLQESNLRNFWDLESVGIQAKELRSGALKPDPSVVQFEKSVSYKESRYEVSLPWKSESVKVELVNNERHALRRLENLWCKLEKDPYLREQYIQVFREYEQEGIIEEIPTHQLEGGYPVFYLPHRPVVRETSTTTKIRPVFDASARGSNGVSLNDCLETGPSLNPNLVEVLLRFRRWQVALTADIAKAFLQVKVRREDRDVHRFLLKDEESVKHYRFVRMPFGNKSSPFLLNATLKFHFKKYPPSEVLSELQENMYVDDWLTGADSPEEACLRFKDAYGILREAGMSLSKCTSNCKTLPITEGSNVEGAKVLGLYWNSSIDCFTFKADNIDPFGDIVCTKRNVLSLIARCFDPLGLICPFMMHAKILFQEIWRLGLDWDELLPEAMQGRVKLWVVGFSVLESLRFNRYLFSEIPWRDMPDIELHAFGDASEKGYGACVYVKVPGKDEFKVTLVAARGKVAPIKKVSLPRLELLGALLCARLVVFVKSALRLGQQIPIQCWTDSTVALAWIKGDPNRWKTFVANRVVEIQELTPPSCWQHCPGKDNSADLISRGVYAEQLKQSDVWLVGPSWLCGSTLPPQEEWQDKSPPEEYCEIDTVCVAVESVSPSFEFSRWSSFSKALNVVGWVLRFSSNCRASAKTSGPLTYEELTKAKVKLFYLAQREAFGKEVNALTLSRPLPKGSSLIKLDPYLDGDGLLRIKGRLENAELSFESKHPIIIPGTHIALLLVRFQHGLLKHAGVATLVSTLRNSYWIIRLRQIAKRVCRECVACRRCEAKACSQPVAPFPELRVKSAPPFTVTGLDYAGPLFCVDFPSQKLYILLFTCAVVRAVHLELTESLSVVNCNLAIRRFTARRGVPSVFYSDNAKTFVCVSNLLKQHYGSLAPQWKFIVPNAPWWGGWWERLIRSVKMALRKTLGTKLLARSELETTLHEVEACINSRPLTFVGEEHDVDTPLTPSHFLIGRSAGFQLELSDEPASGVTSKDLCVREAVRLGQLDKFWKIWLSEYIRNLPCMVKGFKANCHLKKGSVVLIKEENVTRLMWPLGVITELYPGRDGIVRSAKVKTKRGYFTRPVQNLYNLEVSDVSEENVCDSPDENKDIQVAEDQIHPVESSKFDVSTTRKGRAIKAPVKLDL